MLLFIFKTNHPFRFIPLLLYDKYCCDFYFIFAFSSKIDGSKPHAQEDNEHTPGETWILITLWMVLQVDRDPFPDVLRHWVCLSAVLPSAVAFHPSPGSVSPYSLVLWEHCHESTQWNA